MDDLWLIRGGLQEVIALSDLNEYASALASVDNVKTKCDTFAKNWEDSDTETPQIIGNIYVELDDRKKAIIKKVLEKWNTSISWKEQISLDNSFKKNVELSINLSSEANGEFDYDSLIGAIEYIENEENAKKALSHHSKVNELLSFIDQNILGPILDLRVGSLSFSETDDNTLVLLDVERRYDYKSPLVGVYGLETVTKELIFVLVFLQSKLEKKFPSLYQLIKRRSSTRFISTLMGNTFTKLLPQSETELSEFESCLEQSASKLQNALVEVGWLSPGSNELSLWAENLYHEWINCKKAAVFDNIRQKMLEFPRQASFKLERVTDAEFSNNQQQQQPQQQVKNQDTAVSEKTEEADDWDNWNDDEDTNESIEKPEAESADDGWDAWDDDEPVITKEETHNKEEPTKMQKDDGEEEDSWDAWGDDDNDDQITSVEKSTQIPISQSKPTKQSKPLSTKEKPVSNEQSESRKEALLCSVSTLPSYLLSVISAFVNETHRFFQHHPHQNSSNTQHETQVLERSISEILSLYRALSPLCYTNAPIPLIIYNDVVNLISKLRSIEVESSDATSVFSFPNDNTLLFSFADSQYSLAIKEQQEKISQVLAKANHFQNCNSNENLFACQAAIERTINIFYDVSGSLEPYLSFPLRSKVLGSLLEFVASTMIKDIENIMDISAEESSELSKLIKAVQQLEDLFLDPTVSTSSLVAGSEAEEEFRNNAAALTAYYTPSWIKLQYLEQILVSNLEQILYLYRNNSLVDFTASELDELIHSLFAASDQRQKTINIIYGNR